MANVDDLISALSAISPMPDDEDEDALTESVLDDYHKIVSKLGELKDPKSIVPLIDSFGYGDGFGVYWTTLHTLEKFGYELLNPLLIDAIRKGEKGSRMWAAYMLGVSRCREAIDDLISLLKDDNELVRAKSALALGMIGDRWAIPYLEAIGNDVSEAVRSRVEQAIDDMG